MNSSTFHTIYSLSEIIPHLSSPVETLLVFDIDYVLIQPDQPVFQYPNFCRHRDSVQKIYSSLNAQERDLFSNLMVMAKAKSTLIEQSSPGFISDLYQKGYDAIALTAALTHNVESLDLKKERLKRLKTFGFNFLAKPFADLTVEMSSFEANMGQYPLFEEGILFTNGENKKIQKGEALKTLLNKAKTSYKTLVFVDDRKKNIEAMIDSLDKEYTILGFLYEGGMKVPCPEVSVSEFENKWNALAREAKKISQQMPKS